MPSFFFRLPIRIYAVVAMALALSVVLTVLLLSRAVDNAYQMREKELHNVIDSSISLLADLEARVQANELTADEARVEGRALIERVRFDGPAISLRLTAISQCGPIRWCLIGSVRTGLALKM